jgi:DNA topoisomerase IB
VNTLTFDKASVRRVDENGYLHVGETNISKATVNPYYGSEIPGTEQLGLDPKKIYKLLRAPDELEKGAATFNNIPVLDKHIPISSMDLNDPEIKKHVIGSTGTDAKFVGPYLKNSLVIHTQSAIADIEAEKKEELSCAYRYDPVMTPGKFEGEAYDGIMTNIRGNHVALVVEGRAGHDVKVQDSAIRMRTSEAMSFDKLSVAMGSGITQDKKIRLMMGYDGDREGHEFRGNQWHTGISMKVIGKGKEQTRTFLDKNGKPVATGIQKRLAALGVPPAWKDIHLSKDPKAKILCTGVAANGKRQYLYNAKTIEKNTLGKFAKMEAFHKALPAIQNAAAAGLKKGDHTAAAVYIADKTALRVGTPPSKYSTKVAAVGITTMLAKNATVKGDSVRFKFIGKHGVENDKTVKDAALAKFITQAKLAAGPNGKLLNTNDQKCSKFIKDASGNSKFSTKDFRTYYAGAIAMKTIGGAKCKTEKEYKALEKKVCEAVAAHLCNTPGVAKSNYIDPLILERARPR